MNRHISNEDGEWIRGRGFIDRMIMLEGEVELIVLIQISFHGNELSI